MSELYSENPKMFKNNPIGFIFAILLIPVFGLGILILLYWYVQTKATKFTITDDDILLETGILSKERVEVSIKSIRTTKVKQSFFNRIFGVGSIEIYTAGDNAELIAAGLPEPHSIRDLIKQRQNQD